jgi:two-component system, NtrC family, sensor kinase
MKVVQLREWLLPGGAERDEAFYQEILSLSQRGLLATGALEIAIGLAAFTGLMPWQAGLAILATGAATAAAARADSLYPYSRLLAAVSSAMAAAITCFSLNRSSTDFGEAALTLLLLVPVAVPFRPTDSAAIGAFAVAAGIQSGHVLYIAIVACAAVLAAATLYRQRWINYSSYLAVLLSSQELQSRLLLADSSKTMNRLSAALAHELSSPIGTAASAIETLLTVSARQAEAPPGDQKRLATLQTDLLRSLENSMARLRKLVDRFHHVTNLDETATQQANLNEILNTAVAAVRAETENRIAFHPQFNPVPNIRCRPQQLLSVFQSLLRNAAQAIDASGTVSISTRATGSHLEITFEDSGRGIPPDLLARIFDPMFQVVDGRVSTGNWSLFTSRQFIKDHGGEMRIQSQEGRGTTVSVVLPC